MKQSIRQTFRRKKKTPVVSLDNTIVRIPILFSHILFEKGGNLPINNYINL
uniref:Uncharacterized protein n=1 Tax=Heterorhabditis bacteriophora TaxID=37862 RepID=A0A1I7WTM3_HETBA